jgi:very-short-patch-repair endonuclease
MALRANDLPDSILARLPESEFAAYERGKKKTQQESREDEFAFQLKACKFPPVARQHRFAESIGRQWRFDFAFPTVMLAVEIEGLVVTQMHERVGGKLRVRTVVTGRHATITGFRADIEKYNSAAALGWTVLRFEQKQVQTGEALALTRRLLEQKGWVPDDRR